MDFTQDEIEKIKLEAKEYTKWVGTIDEMIKVFAQLKDQGQNYFYNFNGHKCYSLLDDEDACYLKIVGKTKNKYEEEKRILQEEYKRKDAEESKKAKESIPTWIEEGKKYIYPEKEEKWINCVNIRAGDLYHGLDLVNALDVMNYLDNGGTLVGAKKLIDDQGHSGISYGMVMSMLVNFCKRGPELYRYMEKDISPKSEEYLQNIERENAEFAKKQEKGSQLGEA